MNESEILDWNPLVAMGLFPEIDEAIVWSGQPSLKPLIPGVSQLPSIDRFWALYYMGIFICIKNSVELKTYWPLLFALAAIVSLQIIPFLISYFKVSKTAYIVTNKRIVFKTWRFFNENTYILRYDDFQRSTYVMDYPGTRNGTVFLMTGKDVKFWTYNIVNGERQQHPTLECVADADVLSEKIEKIRLEKLREKQPTFSK